MAAEGSAGSIAQMLDLAMRNIRDEKMAEAVSVLQDVLILEPGNLLAVMLLKEIRGQLPQEPEPIDPLLDDQPTNPGIDPRQRVRLKVPLSELASLDLSASHAMVISRLAAGAMDVEELCKKTKMSRSRIFKVLDGLLADGKIST